MITQGVSLVAGFSRMTEAMQPTQATLGIAIRLEQ